MNPEIPGYFYDTEKRKYFKVEQAQTAPSSAWSTETVKRRKLDDEAAAEEQKKADLIQNHIRRSPLVREGGGAMPGSASLARELGMPVSTAEFGRGLASIGDVRAETWGSGATSKGAVRFEQSLGQGAGGRAANMACFYVGGDDERTGLGVAYATLDEETLVGSYIPTDENDDIHFSREAPPLSGRGPGSYMEMLRCPQMSSINYHQPTHRILLTSREPDHTCGFYFFSPPISDPTSDRPHWLLGEANNYQHLSISQRLRPEWLVHGSTPAPASSDLICVMGTSNGILRVLRNESMSWVTPPTPMTPGGLFQNIGDSEGAQVPREVFAQDFQQGNHNVLFAAGRQPRLWTIDMRAAQSTWSFVPQPSSVAHLRSVNEHQILTAGLRNSMDLYDQRFFANSHGPNGVKPILTFPDYRNEAHLHVGWDVSTSLNLVASAQDDGTVKLFSLSSGRRVRCPALDLQGGMKNEPPVKALMFQKMPRERMESLFVGVGAEVRKFSFGAESLDDEA